MKTLGVGVIILLFLVMVLGPVLTIWSLNTLFPALNIPLTLETWAAVVFLVYPMRLAFKS